MKLNLDEKISRKEFLIYSCLAAASVAALQTPVLGTLLRSRKPRGPVVARADIYYGTGPYGA